MDKLSIQDWTQIITAGMMLLGLLGGFIAWLHKVYQTVKASLGVLQTIQKEFMPNGGASLRDSINAIALNQSMALSTRHVLYSYLTKEYNIPMIVVDRSGRCAWANKAYLELTNRELNEVLDINWETTVCAEDRDYVKEEWYNACEDGRSFEITYRLSNKASGDNTVKCIVYGDTHTGYVGFLEKIVPATEKFS